MLQDIERLQLAALLHDIGKFRQRRTNDTGPTFRPISSKTGLGVCDRGL